jgi:hypothetical protein
MLKAQPLVRKTDPRKSSVPCRIQLIQLHNLWFLASPFVVYDMGGSEKERITGVGIFVGWV